MQQTFQMLILVQVKEIGILLLHSNMCKICETLDQKYKKLFSLSP